LAADLAHPDPDAERRRHRRARHLADVLTVAEDPVPLARDSRAGDDEGLEELVRPLLTNPAAGLAAHEPRLLLHAPAETRLDGRALVGQAVAVKAVVDLEAQGVTGPEASRGGSSSDQRVPDGCGGLGGNQELDAVLPGVA